MTLSKAQAELNAALTEQLIRAVVREEIVKALGALAREARDQNVSYETDREDSNIFNLITQAAEGAVGRLTCEHEKYLTPVVQGAAPCCSRCGEPQPEPVNPFEEKTDG